MSKSKSFILSWPFKLLTVCSLIGLLLSYVAPFIHPSTIPLLPFFGLSYPILLVLTICWLVIWALMRSKWAIICLIVLVIGGKLHFRNFSLGNNANNSDPQKGLSVMSFNVRLFDLFNPDFNNALKNRDQIFSFINGQAPDVLCLQEFYRQDKPTRFEIMDSIYRIMGSKEYHERSAHKRRTHENYGIAIFSKYPIISKGDVMFDSQSPQDFNYCIFADIVKNTDTLRVYNVHLQSIGLKSDSNIGGGTLANYQSKRGLFAAYRKLKSAFQKRANQARRVVEHLKNSPYPVIVCGDFNDTPMSYTYNQFHMVLRDAFQGNIFGLGATYIGKLPAGRIDYFFHSPKLSVSNFKIHPKTISDHRPISCVFTYK